MESLNEDGPAGKAERLPADDAPEEVVDDLVGRGWRLIPSSKLAGTCGPEGRYGPVSLGERQGKRLPLLANTVKIVNKASSPKPNKS